MWHKEFSNFYLPEQSFILHENILYPSIEHFFVAMMSEDPAVRLQAAAIEHPAEVKAFGRSFKRRPNWNAVRRSVMLYGLRKKFSHPDLRSLLLGTQDAEIVHEVHWHDNYWASCVCPKCAGKEKVNLLGVLLMKVREELEQGEDVNVYVPPTHAVYHGTPVRYPAA